MNENVSNAIYSQLSTAPIVLSDTLPVYPNFAPQGIQEFIVYQVISINQMPTTERMSEVRIQVSVTSVLYNRATEIIDSLKQHLRKSGLSGKQTGVVLRYSSTENESYEYENSSELSRGYFDINYIASL